MEINDWRDGDMRRELPFKSFWIADFQDDDRAGLPALVVFSHLRWDSPYRRPQEILSRLAQRTRVLFVEEPRFHAGDPDAIARARRFATSPC